MKPLASTYSKFKVLLDKCFFKVNYFQIQTIIIWGTYSLVVIIFKEVILLFCSFILPKILFSGAISCFNYSSILISISMIIIVELYIFQSYVFIHFIKIHWIFAWSFRNNVKLFQIFITIFKLSNTIVECVNL